MKHWNTHHSMRRYRRSMWGRRRSRGVTDDIGEDFQLHHLSHWSTFNTIAIKLNKVFINKSYFNSIQIKINNKQGFCHYGKLE